MMAGAHLSKEFFDLIKSIGEAKSKQEEDRIITGEIAELKRRLADRTLIGKKLKEFLLRVVYVEMLGHDASFGYMKAVELSASANLLEKRVAYLAAGLCFAPEHEFRMMLVNRLQRDLQSANVLEVSIALPAAAKILTPDMIPAVLPIVNNLLKHDQDIVRKKTVMLLHRFLQLQPDSVAHMGDKFRRALCDKDPAVMGASLHVFHELVRADATPYKDLVPSFVSILKQVAEGRLPRDFDYHRVPAPWLQLKLLRILALLGRADQSASEQMYEVLLDVMRRGDTGSNVGFALVYECVRTVTSIYPNTALLDAAAASIARFISSENHNLKYLGVTGLAAIVKDHPRYAAEHQLAVLDCLEDADETLKRKTLDLLYRMTNPANVEVVTAKLLEHLRASTDPFLRSDLVARITAAAERFAPSNSWYIGTMTAVFEAGGDLVRPEVAHNLQRLIAEGGGEEDGGAGTEVRREAVEALLGLADKPALPNILLQTLFWVLGEYGALATSLPLPAVLEKVAALAGRAGLDTATRGAALSAVTKLTAQLGGVPPAPATTLTGKYAASRTADLAQRCAEFSALVSRPSLMVAVLPLDASTEDVDVGELDFLGPYVRDALSAGARPYAPPAKEAEEEARRPGAASGGSGEGGGLRFEAYERQDASTLLPPGPDGLGAPPSSAAGGGGLPGLGGAGAFEAGGLGGGLGFGAGLGGGASKGMWSREGYKTAAGVLSEKPAPTAAAGSAPGAAAPVGTPAAGADRDFAVSKRPWDFGAPAVAMAPVAPSPAPAAAAPAPPPPRELTEKEKLAAALFGGIGAGSGAGTAKAGVGMGARPATSAPAPAAAVRPAGGAAAAPAAPGPAAAAARPVPAPAPSASADDLLGLFGTPAPAPAPARASAGGSLVDMFGPPAPAAAPVAASDPFGGAFGGLSLGGAAAWSPDWASLPVPPAWAPALAAPGTLREPAAGGLRIAGDGTLAIAAQRVLAPDALHVLLWVVNTGAAATSAGSVLALEPPPYLRVTGLQSTAGPASAGGAPLGSIPPRGSACVLASFALAQVPRSGAINGSIRGAGSPAGLPFSLASPVLDVLRPAAIDTPSFGGIWTQPAMAAEATTVVPGSSVRSPGDLMARVPSLRLHPVQAIVATSEGIAAARVMGMPSVFALLHARCLPAGLELRVKTPERTFTEAVLTAAAAGLQ